MLAPTLISGSAHIPAGYTCAASVCATFTFLHTPQRPPESFYNSAAQLLAPFKIRIVSSIVANRQTADDYKRAAHRNLRRHHQHTRRSVYPLGGRVATIP